MERLTMSKTREILRARWALGLSVREASRATSASTGVVSKTASRAQKAGLTWEAVEALSERELERRLYGESVPAQSDRAEPDPVWMHRELRRKGVTLELLHLEYLADHPTGFRYTAFCDRYRGWLSRQSVVMRQVHRAGEKCFVDYSGMRLSIVDPVTSERIPVELFVAALGASSLTFALGTLTQQVPDFVRGHVKAFEYFGGAELLVLDDLGLSTPTESQRNDLLEVLEDRYGRASTVVTSQLEQKKWHEWIGEPTIADAILDRLVHNAYKIELIGPSGRKDKGADKN
jgi:transposase